MKALMLVLALVLGALPGCTKGADKNSVDIDQIESDDSNDYRHIFKDTIEEQKHKSNRYKKWD